MGELKFHLNPNDNRIEPFKHNWFLPGAVEREPDLNSLITRLSSFFVQIELILKRKHLRR